MTTPYDDPFSGGVSNPSVSFKDAKPGTKVKGRVVAAPKLVQGRDFETSEPAWWDDAKTQPKMTVVTELDINGTVHSLWAQKPSAMFAALAEAQQKSGRIEVGGELEVEFTHEEPNKKNPRLNPAKQYRATYTPADAFEGDEEQPPF